MSLYHMHCVSTAVEASLRGSRRCTSIQETCAEDDTWLAALKYPQSRGRLLVEVMQRAQAREKLENFFLIRLGRQMLLVSKTLRYL